VPKHIESTIPQDRPIKTSCKIIGSRSIPTKISKGGNLILLKTQTPIPNEKTILTGKGTMRDPKKGEDKRKDPTLKVDNNNNKRYTGILCILIPA
jgi:hypothetical protein